MGFVRPGVRVCLSSGIKKATVLTAAVSSALQGVRPTTRPAVAFLISTLLSMDEPQPKEFYRFTIPAGQIETFQVSPEIVAAVEAELGPPDPDIWCSCNNSQVSVGFCDDYECDCGIEKHHYHCTACGGLYQIG